VTVKYSTAESKLTSAVQIYKQINMLKIYQQIESQIVKHCKQISFWFFLKVLVFSVKRTSYGS